MVDHATNGIRNFLIGQFEQLTAELSRLKADYRPGIETGIFEPVLGAPADLAQFDLKPIVFNLPEKPGTGRYNLFVVVTGRLSFDRQAYLDRGLVRTRDFASRIAYFRLDRKALAHVFGAHYEFEPGAVGHPVFHAQFRSFAEFADEVKRQYFRDSELTRQDRMKGLLTTVRIPSAQLDVFSLFLQLCADHLMHKNSGPDEKRAFNSLLDQVVFCQGGAYQIARLGTDAARLCYRSRHWYPVIS